MAGEWVDVALEDVADELTVGYVGPMASEYLDEGIPFLRSQNVDPLRIDKYDLKFIVYYVNTVAGDHVAAHLVGAVQQHFNVA